MRMLRCETSAARDSAAAVRAAFEPTYEPEERDGDVSGRYSG